LDIVDHSTSCGVNIKYIVKRIIAHVPEEVIADLKTVEIFDFAPGRKGFARYVRHENKIDLYVHEDIGWLPWILKKTFIFPYLLVGLALGHEIDHHVNRDRVMTEEDREKSAESNAMKYIYPSFGALKPVARLVRWLIGRNMKKGSQNSTVRGQEDNAGYE
jgi:hypothetical protein